MIKIHEQFLFQRQHFETKGLIIKMIMKSFCIAIKDKQLLIFLFPHKPNCNFFIAKLIITEHIKFIVNFSKFLKSFLSK